jgi:hypothetical protein
MTPFFGSKDDDGGGAVSDDAAALDAEIARLDGLPLADLAAEAMSKGFGPDGPGGPGKPGSIDGPPEASSERLVLLDIARVFTPAFAGKGVSQAQSLRFQTLVAEGLQILENASLIRVTWRGGQEHYLATRRGRKALADGTLGDVLARLDLE